MEFIVSCSYCTRGEAVLINYPVLKNYHHRIENDELYIIVSSLEELIKIRDDVKNSLIIDRDGEMVIYDGYIE